MEVWNFKGTGRKRPQEVRGQPGMRPLAIAGWIWTKQSGPSRTETGPNPRPSYDRSYTDMGSAACCQEIYLKLSAQRRGSLPGSLNRVLLGRDPDRAFDGQCREPGWEGESDGGVLRPGVESDQ